MDDLVVFWPSGSLVAVGKSHTWCQGTVDSDEAHVLSHESHHV